MNDTRLPGPRDRDRSVDRLRWIGRGVAAGGLTAVVGFGAVAALSNPGTTVDATTGGSTTTDGTTTTTDTTTQSTTTQSTTTSTLTAPTTAPAATAAPAQVTTGGSG